MTVNWAHRPCFYALPLTFALPPLVFGVKSSNVCKKAFRVGWLFVE